MTEITPNVAVQPQIQPMPQRQAMMTPNGQMVYVAPELSARDEYVKQHKKNTLSARLYNWLKNVTKLGTGSKKVEVAVEKAEKGEITEEQAKEIIKKYRNSQANTTQVVGDVASILVAIGGYFKARNNLKYNSAKALINEKFYKANPTAKGAKLHNYFLKLTKSNKKFFMATAITTMISAASIKWLVTMLDRIGSKRFVTNKKDYNNLMTPIDEASYKMDRKANRKARRKDGWRNLLSGAINGITMPLVMLGGTFIGVPLYLATNLLNRYFVGNTEERNKSFKGFMENLKNDGILHTVAALGMGIPLIIKGRWSAKHEASLKSAVDKLKNAKLTNTEFNRPTTYQELSDMMLKDNPEIAKLFRDVENGRVSTDEAITKLTQENIFACKFKQISADNTIMTLALKEDCPPTRCFKKADGTWDLTDITKYVKDNLGDGYKIEKCLGVGTVAETYLAKDPSGKEVCLKVLKVIDKDKGTIINAEKILEDKEKFVKLIENSGKSADEIAYLKRNLDDLANGILKEVDFNNEMKAAEKLAKTTKLANVVKGLEVKNGIYVMERAQGISLDSLMNLYAAQSYKEAFLKMYNSNSVVDAITGIFSVIGTGSQNQSRLSKILADARKRGASSEDIVKLLDDEIARIKSKTPNIDDFDLKNEDIKYLINEYNQVLGEQLGKVEKGGKVVHADIHPGNIFIDLNALKANVKKQNSVSQKLQETGIIQHKNGKIFTLIDTGNVIEQSADHAIGSIKLKSYLEGANYKDIADYVLNGAVLPEGMSKEQALKLVQDDLKGCFFDLTTNVEPMTTDGLLDLTSNIMRKHKIIPSDTQLNLNKAKNSAANSLKDLETALATSRLKDMSVQNMAAKKADSMGLESMYKRELARQEKLNLKQMTIEQKRKFKKNPNMYKDNSEDVMLFRLKQDKIAETDTPVVQQDPLGDMFDDLLP